MSNGLPRKMVAQASLPAALAISLEQETARACPTPQEAGEVSDMELVNRFQRGEEAAFDALVRRHQQRAFNIAFGLLREREDALEVAQDAFVRAYRALKDFRGESAFTTWLYRVTVNLARNKSRWNRVRARDRTVSLDAPLDHAEPNGRTVELPDTTYGPDRQAMVSEETKLVETAMKRLSKKSREILILRNVENLAYDEIAKVLGFNLGTVKSRIARAREELRALVEGTQQ